jgi:dCTP deaminase
LMCVLSDRDILRAIEAGLLRIDDFQESCLTPNGYDLRVSEILLGGEERPVRSGSALLPPMRQAFISTKESVELPVDVCAQLWLRTTWIRRGIIAGLGKVDAGFRGTLTFSAFNLSENEVEIPIGERFVQIVFEGLSTPSDLSYEKRSGHYQGQSGITLEPLDERDR